MADISDFRSIASSAALSSALVFTPAIVASENTPVAVVAINQAGSGGVSTLRVALAGHEWLDSGGNVSVHLDVPLPPQEQLAYMRNVMGVSITDLAELLNVARPTVYSWMMGTEPRDEHLERLQHLERQTRDIETYGLSGLGKLLKRPLRGGCTLLELIKSNQPVDTAMAELAAVARLEEKQRSGIKGSRRNVSTAEAAKDQSMPGYSGEA